MTADTHVLDDRSFREEVVRRFGMLPNLFSSFPPELWAFAKTAYLDNPLPPLLKERLVVHLSRFCEARYCVVRHTGFLIGMGRPAGDSGARPMTVEQVLRLLRRPVRDVASSERALRHLRSSGPGGLPEPETEAENRLFDALTIVFLAPIQSERARKAVRALVGDHHFDLLTALLSFVRTAHYWTETHPEIGYEADMAVCLERHPELAALLLDPGEAVEMSPGSQLRRAVGNLDRAKEALNESEAVLAAQREALEAALNGSPLETSLGVLANAAIDHYRDDVRAAFYLADPEDKALHHIVGAPSDCAPVLAAEAEGCWSFPIHSSKGAFVGALALYWRSPREATRHDTDFASLLAHSAGIIIARDIEAKLRRSAEQKLRESEERQRLTVELVPALLWWADAAGRNISANYRWKLYTGQDNAEIQDFGWLGAVYPADVAETRAAFRHAFATGEPLERQQRIRRMDGEYRWHLIRHVPVRGDDGAITGWFGAAIDVHELHELQGHQQVLVGELQHRTRNLMGVVRSMANRTGETSSDLADFRRRFSDRLDALARVQGLLSRLGETGRIAFDELIGAELAAMGEVSRQITLDGPPGIRLRSSMVQTLAMALHELATNAVKYGALGQPQARLSVRWRMGPPDPRGRPWLTIDWHESGVRMQPSGTVPQGTGQGRELIEKALPYQLGAETSFELGADGVRCRISIPVSASNGEAEASGGRE